MNISRPVRAKPQATRGGQGAAGRGTTGLVRRVLYTRRRCVGHMRGCMRPAGGGAAGAGRARGTFRMRAGGGGPGGEAHGAGATWYPRREPRGVSHSRLLRGGLGLGPRYARRISGNRSEHKPRFHKTTPYKAATLHLPALPAGGASGPRRRAIDVGSSGADRAMHPGGPPAAVVAAVQVSLVAAAGHGPAVERLRVHNFGRGCCPCLSLSPSR